MSLFGTSPDDAGATKPAKPQSKSLFDDEPTGGSSNPNGSLFSDDIQGGGDSPWSFPTPKKATRGDLIKNLLPARDVPESYVDAFDTILECGERTGTNVSAGGISKLLQNSNLSSSEQNRLLKVVSPAGHEHSGLGRQEFNVLLALIGLAQEGEEATLDGVDERRSKLPTPSLSYVDSLKTTKESETTTLDLPAESSSPTKTSSTTTSSRPGKFRRDSLLDPEADPWASPATPKPQTRAVHNEVTPAQETTTARPVVTVPQRTTSAFTTHTEDPDRSSRTTPVPPPPANLSATSGAWDSFGNTSGGFPTSITSGLGGGGFGSGGDEPNLPGRTSRAIGGGRETSRGVDEIVTVTLIPEKEGMFMFQHRNYEVKSARRGSSVVRRYSDFVWLLDCLHNRYPFRQLPLLPPKRVAVNGRHLSSDSTFIDKRRRGLVRCSNALVRHPVLCQEQLVVMFLTVPTELAVWRKQATISVQEEFLGKPLPPGLEDSLPTNLADTFDTVRASVKRAAETYIGLCNLTERLAKRNQGVAADSLRFSQALGSLAEETEGTYAVDVNDVPSVNAGIRSTAKHLEISHSLLEDEARAWDEGILEDLKRQRDCLVSIRDVFDRRDRYAKNNIPQLERRIENNEAKLANIRAKPEGTVKPGEAEKVENAILSDKQSIVDQHARGVFIQECIRDELVFFQQSQFHVSKLHQDWSQERVKYSELQADNWRALSEEVDRMPLGE